MSTIKTTNITHGSNSGTNNLILDDTGKVSIAEKKLYCPGGIIQVQSTTKKDYFHHATTTITDITGLDVTITPTYNTSKILLMANVNFGGSANVYASFFLKRDTTLIGVSTTVSGDNRVAANFGGHLQSIHRTRSSGVHYMDDPYGGSGTPAAITYKVACASQYNSEDIMINRTSSTANDSYNIGVTSSITAMEIAV